jgi:hypothetical protein
MFGGLPWYCIAWRCCPGWLRPRGSLGRCKQQRSAPGHSSLDK